MRRILTVAVTALVTVFLLALVVSTAAFAADPAKWAGADISYEGDTYTKKTADGTTPPGLSNNQVYFVHNEVTDTFSGTGESRIIYFDSGTNMSTTDTANLTVYSLDGSGAYGARISGPADIALVPQNGSATANQAIWQNNNLEFDGATFEGTGGGPRISDGTTAPVLPQGTQYYEARGSPDVLTGTGTLRVLYFPAGVDVLTATTASYATFAIDGSGAIGAQTGSTQQVAVIPASQTPGSTGTAGAGSCSVEGIGWIVCPVTQFLAWGMDRIFDMLEGFLEVQPLSTQTDSPLYQAWNMIRTIANLAFVAAFLIIIYSQITSIGLDNYSIKKLLPRLILTAILVNLSYLICAAAVDLSNITGSGLQDFLVGLRETLEGPNTNSITSWESVTGFILADVAVSSAAAVTIGGIIISTGGSLGAALILLLPMLLGLILAVLVALLVLAARQALIVILIIVAPLAFVAYLLPNTEKLFEKWRSIFVTMLVFFPLFALIFGGSQLAAWLIIQTATDINVILLAMFVQVAPLVLTPLLVRFSGGIIGRIAGFVNDPKKGLIDRTRNWAKQESEFLAARNMARRDPVRRRQVFRRFALGADQLRRNREDRLAAYKEASDARWANSQNYSDIQQDLRYAQDERARGTEVANLRYETSRSTSARVRNLDLDSRDLKLRVENAKAQADVQWEGYNTAAVAEQRLRSRVLKDQISAIHSTHDAEYEEFKHGRLGHYPVNPNVGAMLNQATQDTRLLALNALRSESAKRAVNEQFTKDIENNDRFQGQLMQSYAGGIQGVAGAQRALAAAINAQSKAHSEAVANATSILTHGNFGDNIVTQIALGRNAGTSVVVTDDMREAAIAKIASGGNTVEIMNLMRDLEINPSAGNQDFRQTFADSLLANSNKPKFAGAGILANIKQGIAPPVGKARLDQYIAETINANKLGSADTLVTQDRDYLTAVRDTLRNNLSSTPISPAAKATMKSAIQMARTNALYAGKIGERKQVFDEIERLL